MSDKRLRPADSRHSNLSTAQLGVKCPGRSMPRSISCEKSEVFSKIESFRLGTGGLADSWLSWALDPTSACASSAG